jgi:hypothetical protein
VLLNNADARLAIATSNPFAGPHLSAEPRFGVEQWSPTSEAVRHEVIPTHLFNERKPIA